MANYMSDSMPLDEMQEAVPTIFECLKKFNIPATWFARIDDKMEIDYGTRDYILSHYSQLLADMKAEGHEIAWHFHSYKNSKGKWVQNDSELQIIKELERNWQSAKIHNLNSLRMGWAYHTQKTYKCIDSFNLEYDSTALPRINYPWEMNLRNWNINQKNPYYPSQDDYRAEGVDNFKTLEIPLSTQPISSESDTIDDMVRLINPAYKHEIFCDSIKNHMLDDIILVTHPYEVLSLNLGHSLLSFRTQEFEKNISWLHEQNFKFDTLINFKKKYERNYSPNHSD